MLIHPSTKISIQKEYYINDINSLFGNIGGMVGLLIGASLLSLVDYFLTFMQRSTKKLGTMFSGE